MVLLAALAYIFARGSYLVRHSDQRFAVALAGFMAAVLWPVGISLMGGLDARWNLVPCSDFRALILRNVEFVWGPLIVASARLLWVIAR